MLTVFSLKPTGGEGGIRTHGTRKGTTVFETAPIDHSGTSPHEKLGLLAKAEITYFWLRRC
jgi:hypothetical protein